MPETVTKSAKYIFLDIVGFTHNRSVEAQTDLIEVLNRAVLDALSTHNVDDANRILLPTGDGICLVLLNAEDPYDIHIMIALSIIKRIDEYGATAADEQRKFKIRVGLNSNVDNLIIDINGNRNIAGAGINLAQRVMSVADGNQILVGQPVYDMLSQREQYMHAFRPYIAEVKHGLKLNAYQLVIDGFAGLDVSTPSQFREAKKAIPAPQKLSEIAAYYMAHAMVHRAEIASCVEDGQASYSLVVLLSMLARDSHDTKHRTLREPASTRYARKYEVGFLGQFKFYESQDFWICSDLAETIVERQLGSARQFFDGGGYAGDFEAHFVTPEGQRKLKEGWPSIWEEFGLEAHSNLE